MNMKKPTHLELIALITSLRMLEPGATHLYIEYAGWGDSGDIDAIELRHGNHIVRNELPVDLAVPLEDWVYGLLSREYGGWEIDEGSNGTIRIDLTTLEVEWAHDDGAGEEGYKPMTLEKSGPLSQFAPR